MKAEKKIMYQRLEALIHDFGFRFHLLLAMIFLLIWQEGVTIHGREYCGRATHHHYEIYLELNDIEHRRTKPASPQTNGFVERFNRTVVDEFFRIAFREKFYPDIPSLQKDLDGWLKHYNDQRPHQGYRNRGKRPFETIISSKNNISTVSKEG